MASVTLTITDDDDGAIDVRFECDPPLELEAGRVPESATPAQQAGAAVLGIALRVLAGAGGHAVDLDADAELVTPPAPSD